MDQDTAMLKRQNHLLLRFVGRAYTATLHTRLHTPPRDMTTFSSHIQCQGMIMFRHHARPQATDMLRRCHVQHQVMDTSSRHVPHQDTMMTTVRRPHAQPRCMITVPHNVQRQDSRTCIRRSHNRLHLDLMLRRCGVVLVRSHSCRRQSQRFPRHLRTRRPHRIRTRTIPPIRGSRWLIGA
jgi:hypothetical protein